LRGAPAYGARPRRRRPGCCSADRRLSLHTVQRRAGGLAQRWKLTLRVARLPARSVAETVIRCRPLRSPEARICKLNAFFGGLSLVAPSTYSRARTLERSVIRT